MKKLITSTILSGTLASSLFAGNAGCGLGYVIFNGDASTTATQMLQATTNHMTSTQFLGMTSGTSGCSKASSFVDNDTQKFVDDNMDKLALDISKGHGESLDTLAILLKIEDKKKFSSTLQANFDKLFVNEDITSSELINNIFKITA